MVTPSPVTSRVYASGDIHLHETSAFAGKEKEKFQAWAFDHPFQQFLNIIITEI
jgi:hypothetical protein